MSSKLTLKNDVKDLSNVIDVKLQDLSGSDKMGFAANKSQEYLQKQEQKKAREKIRKSLDYLIHIYPKAFSKVERKPLKKNIHLDILKDFNDNNEFGVSRTSVRRALAFYTHSSLYYSCIIENKQRYDLNGKVVEEVTAEEVTYTNEQLQLAKAKGAKNPRNKRNSFRSNRSEFKRPY